jgi:hypothetical protein
MKAKEIKQKFKDKFNLELGYFNDLNTTKTIRRIKITYIGNTRGVNLLDQNITEYYDYFKNELGLSNVELIKGRNWYQAKQLIVIKLENK